MTEMVADAGNKRPIVHGVDSLRIAAAAWVALGHGAYPDLGAMVAPLSKPLAAGLHLLTGTLFNGAAAVAIFFIISGFCIHYPNVGKATLDWRTFLVRRGLRIGIPMAVILAIALWLGGQFREIELNLFWSLYCELIYYALYPLLFLALKRVKLQHILYGSALISAVMLLLAPSTNILWKFGVQWTWLFCYPGWLLGALLAQNFSHGNRRFLPGSLWIWRGVAVAISAVTEFARFHIHPAIGVPWSIGVVVVYGYFWIRDELLAYRAGKLSGWLETLGAASYTVYLVHVQVLTAVEPFIGKWNPILLWLTQAGGIILAATAFYFAVERPAHNLARRIKFTAPAPTQPRTEQHRDAG